jgi:hypothetical protein
MTTHADKIQQMIDYGRGQAARVLGAPFFVYRVSSNAAVNFIDPLNLIQSEYPVYYTQQSGSAFKGSFEGTSLRAPLFNIVGDMAPFLVGDVFVDADVPYVPYGGPLTADGSWTADSGVVTADTGASGYGAGATSVTFPTLEFEGFCLGFHGPVKKSIGARLNALAQIYSLPTKADWNGYLSADISSCPGVVLTNGQFSLGASGQTPALIPVGISSEPRWRGDLIRGLPTTTQAVVYIAYVPPLNGFSFKEGDRLVLQSGARYVVQNPYEQQVGFSGSQLILEREVSQN